MGFSAACLLGFVLDGHMAGDRRFGFQDRRGKHDRPGRRGAWPGSARGGLDESDGELIAQGQSPVAALSGGYHIAWAIGAALAIASVVIAATILKSATPVTSHMAIENEAEEACG